MSRGTGWAKSGGCKGGEEGGGVGVLGLINPNPLMSIVFMIPRNNVCR